MSFRSLSITAAASFVLVLLSQENVHAGFLVEHGDAWHAVGDGVGSGPTSPESNSERDAEALGLAKVLSHYLPRDAAQFGRIGCSAPGGMSSSSGDTTGHSGPVLLVGSLVRLSGVQRSMWLQLEGSPRLPPPLGTMILQPPRA
jgi:hypothetical protein